MTKNANRALLPAGLRDILPPFAEREAEIVTRVMNDFMAQGYQRIKPPMIEFEESLLSGSGAAMAKHIFRVMDPVSQRMMGLRADITPQVARVATTRLAGAARPLRLSYAGQALRVKGSQLRQERQFGQAGIELIGTDSAEADAEVIIMAAEAVRSLGITSVSIDLALPRLVALIVGDLKGGDGELLDALDHKDATTVMATASPAARILARLIEAVGPADIAMEKLAALDLPVAAAALRERAGAVLALVKSALPDLQLTVDPVESRGFEYQSGVAFTLFSREISAELGRGGRYLADGEPAVGATLFMDTLLDVMPEPEAPRSVFVPAGTPRAVARDLRAQGWRTVAGLAKVADPAQEAKRLGCSHVLANGQVFPLN